jgi:hypothetical protein
MFSVLLPPLHQITYGKYDMNLLNLAWHSFVFYGFLRHYAFNFIRIYLQNGAAQILDMHNTAFPTRSYIQTNTLLWCNIFREVKIIYSETFLYWSIFVHFG